MTDHFEALRRLIPLFERLALPYAVKGGIAVRAYGIPRPTYDLDFTLALPRPRLGELYAADQETGYTVPEAFQTGWVDQISGLSLVGFTTCKSPT